ncbi:MAG: hypothetical protein ACJLS3_10630 [Erythrobacter sp.]
MEQAIIRRLCPGQPVRTIGCNGDTVAIERLCDFVETQIRSLGNRNFPIFVIFDRENRADGCGAISSQVLTILHQRGLHDHDIRVFVADRESEDWYLKDKESIIRHYNLPDRNGEFRGKGGLEKFLSPDIDYHETTIGVDLFFVVSKTKIADECGVFQALCEDAVEVGCGHFQGLL